MRRFCLPALLLGLLASPLRAAIRNTVNYQGFLTNKSNGSPIHGVKDMQFALCDTLAGSCASPIFSETRCLSGGKAVSVLNGHYEVEIGSNTTGGVPTNIFASSSAVWLEVRVDPDDNCASFEALSPRVRLVASPYAFEALHASTASASSMTFRADTISTLDATTNGGVTVSTHLLVSGGRMAVGSTERGTALWVQGATEDTFHLRVSSQDSTGTLLTVHKTGNVGVGTANPTHRLDVNGGVLLMSSMTMVQMSAPGLSLANFGGIYFDSGDKKFKASESGASYQNLVSAGGTGVAKAGDTMTGQLTVSGSSLTIVNGSASDSFSLAVTTALNRGAYHLYVATTGSVEYYGLLRRWASTVTATEQDAKTIVNLSVDGIASAAYTTLGGGYSNTASSEAASVGGGNSNYANSAYAMVGGGTGNHASDLAAVVGGGTSNKAVRPRSVVGGGANNLAAGGAVFSDGFGAVGGGINNTASGLSSSVLGGSANTASADYAAVGGGQSNLAGAMYAFVPGGSANQVTSRYSFAAGYQALAGAEGMFLWVDRSYTGAVQAGTTDQFYVQAKGGFYVDTSSVTFTGSATANKFVLLSGGNVGISSANPIGLFTVGNATMVATSAGLVGFSTSVPVGLFTLGDGTRTIAVMPNGHLGIGTSYAEKKFTMYVDQSYWGNGTGGEFLVVNKSTIGPALSLQSTDTGGVTYSIFSTGNTPPSPVGQNEINGGRLAFFDNTNSSTLADNAYLMLISSRQTPGVNPEFYYGVGITPTVGVGPTDPAGMQQGPIGQAGGSILHISSNAADASYNVLLLSTGPTANYDVFSVKAVTGWVGMGTGTPANTLDVNGDMVVRAYSTSSSSTLSWDSSGNLALFSSTARLKDRIRALSGEDYDRILEEIVATPLYDYRYIDDPASYPRRTGLLAEGAPRALRMFFPAGNLNVDFYSYQGGYSWAGIKGVSRRLDVLREESAEQELRLRRLERDVEEAAR